MRYLGQFPSEFKPEEDGNMSPDLHGKMKILLLWGLIWKRPSSQNCWKKIHRVILSLWRIFVISVYLLFSFGCCDFWHPLPGGVQERWHGVLWSFWEAHAEARHYNGCWSCSFHSIPSIALCWKSHSQCDRNFLTMDTMASMVLQCFSPLYHSISPILVVPILKLHKLQLSQVP